MSLRDGKISGVVDRSVEARELNYFLDNVKIDIAAFHESLLKEGNYVTAQAVKARYVGTSNQNTTLVDIIKYHEEKMLSILE
jgi:hypothetical protein